MPWCSRFACSRATHHPSGPLERAAGAIRTTIVELEFEGGPLNGRRITAVASTADMTVVLDAAGRPHIASGSPAVGSIGVYRFAHQYDCARTFEYVYAFR